MIEGSLILEKLAEHDLLDEFMAAADADDLVRVYQILESIGIDQSTIRMVLEKIDSL